MEDVKNVKEEGCGRKIGDFRCCSVVCGDCLELMARLPAGCVDCVITDPPYGVLVPGDLYPRVRDDRGGRHGLVRLPYNEYLDTYENFCSQIVPRLRVAVSIAKRAAVFSGPHITEQPKFVAIGGVYCPAGTGRHSWGFVTFRPVLLYGSAPDIHLGAKPNVIQSSATSEENGHPCPKPLEWMLWLVSLASRDGETILDPFLGSGTTVVAALKLGRHFLGFEISETYCQIARQRIASVQAQPRLFDAPQPEQLTLG